MPVHIPVVTWTVATATTRLEAGEIKSDGGHCMNWEVAAGQWVGVTLAKPWENRSAISFLQVLL